MFNSSVDEIIKSLQPRFGRFTGWPSGTGRKEGAILVAWLKLLGHSVQHSGVHKSPTNGHSRKPQLVTTCGTCSTSFHYCADKNLVYRAILGEDVDIPEESPDDPAWQAPTIAMCGPDRGQTKFFDVPDEGQEAAL